MFNHSPKSLAVALASLTVLALSSYSAVWAQESGAPIPHAQDRPPGDPLTPEEAVAKMTVPEGFTVEIVASEPEILNPTAMCIDEKGRFWICESIEYPRRSPGEGKDRIKVLEDTNGDGKVDKVSIFAEGLNIPCGIAVGYGGVWISNSPDILFLQDTDGDGKADKKEVIVTGFGRDDTHELPNAFTWGPDGWLYGLNGVFNPSDVHYGKDNPNFDAAHPGWKFTCALYRIHPRTKEFQVFAEGTSNPWGIAINERGDFFISACVIDHLWHITESGYYIRQGGPYPPNTWPMRSIVDHKHQKAAYCGIVWCDTDAYPEEYRGVLMMGNIHGGCINADIATPSGSTYWGTPHPGFPAKPGAWDHDEYGLIAKTGDEKDPKLADFLTANDAWFMPVSQKIGPDGCLYVLDWYDRYHCYQDANRDPEGIDRLKGRLYRVRYQDTPRAKDFDLSKKTDDELLTLLGDPNVFIRETAQRLLSERASAVTIAKLDELIFSSETPSKVRMHAMWARSAIPHQDTAWITQLIGCDDPIMRAWGIRLAGDRQHLDGSLTTAINDAVVDDKIDRTPPELLQLVIALGKSRDDRAIDGLYAIAARRPNDTHLQQIVWENAKEVIPRDPAYVVNRVPAWLDATGAGLATQMTLLVELAADSDSVSGTQVGNLVANLISSDSLSAETRAEILGELESRIQSGTFRHRRLEEAKAALLPKLQSLEVERPFADRLVISRALLADQAAIDQLPTLFKDNEASQSVRLDALRTLISQDDENVLRLVREVLPNSENEFRLQVIDSIGRYNNLEVADVLLEQLSQVDARSKPRVIEVLTQRPRWAQSLLQAIQEDQVDKSLLNLNQLQRISSFNSLDVQVLVAKIYGQVRTTRSDRQRVVRRQQQFLASHPGDPFKGAEVFKKVCAQCHKIYGEGAEVGPEITANGRNDWEQLLQNVFDPSAVIGPGYQARMIATADGRVLTGLPVEETDERLVLKIQGGKLETIPKNEIDADKVSELSMMPEDLEKTVTEQELADLFAFLALDAPPGNPNARRLPGAPEPKRRDDKGEGSSGADE